MLFFISSNVLVTYLLYLRCTCTCSISGDTTLDIPPLPQLQPAYLFNTIVTMSQRNNSAANAQRAFDRMKYHNLAPDIFTLTALLDVVGRNGDVDGAFAIYEMMMSSDNTRPNIVTFCTLIRMTSKLISPEEGTEKVRMLLRDSEILAREPIGAQVSDCDGIIDSSIYNAALAASVKYMNRELLKDVLKSMKSHRAQHGHVDCEDIQLPALTCEIVCKFTIKFCDAQDIETECHDNFLQSLVDTGAISALDAQNIKLHISERVNRLARDLEPAEVGNVRLQSKHSKQSSPYVENMSYLGPRSPESLRETVINHDLMRLSQRLHTVDVLRSDESNETAGWNGRAGLLSEADFVTLIHQCRKRKWAKQVNSIISFMADLHNNGLKGLGITSSAAITIQFITVEAAMEAFFAGHLPDRAWEFLQEVFKHLRYKDGSSKLDSRYAEAMNLDETQGLTDFHHKFTADVIR